MSLDGVRPVSGPLHPSSSAAVSGTGFHQLVEQKVTFSRHAQERMRERQIALTGSEVKALSDAMKKVRATGAKQAAIVMAPGIFIVAPQNNTVITTVTKNPSESMQVISNVDALVMVGRTSSEDASSPRPIDGGQPAPVHWSLIPKMG